MIIRDFFFLHTVLVSKLDIFLPKMDHYQYYFETWLD